jgi:hypothetical protein
MMRAMAWRWTSLSLDGWPGDLPFRRPSGPRSLKCVLIPGLLFQFESAGVLKIRVADPSERFCTDRC